jgi:hypothetical protein
LGGDPAAGFEVNAAEAEVKGGFLPVVVAGAEVEALGEADVVFNHNRGEVVDPEGFAEPAVVADGESPGEFDFDAGFDADALAEGGAEAAQEPDFEAREGLLSDSTKLPPVRFEPGAPD